MSAAVVYNEKGVFVLRLVGAIVLLMVSHFSNAQSFPIESPEKRKIKVETTFKISLLPITPPKKIDFVKIYDIKKRSLPEDPVEFISHYMSTIINNRYSKVFKYLDKEKREKLREKGKEEVKRGSEFYSERFNFDNTKIVYKVNALGKTGYIVGSFGDSGKADFVLPIFVKRKKDRLYITDLNNTAVFSVLFGEYPYNDEVIVRESSEFGIRTPKPAH